MLFVNWSQLGWTSSIKMYLHYEYILIFLIFTYLTVTLVISSFICLLSILSSTDAILSHFHLLRSAAAASASCSANNTITISNGTITRLPKNERGTSPTSIITTNVVTYNITTSSTVVTPNHHHRQAATFNTAITSIQRTTALDFFRSPIQLKT